MTHDYANRSSGKTAKTGKTAKNRKTSKPRSAGKTPRSANGQRRDGAGSNPVAIAGIAFTAGLLCGVLAMFLLWLQPQKMSGSTSKTAAGTQEQSNLTAANKPTQAAEGDEFQFYRELAEREVWVPVVEEYVSGAKQSANTAQRQYALQAGSFRDAADADRQRAAILLLGLPVNTQPVDLDSGGRWHRVVVGPFDHLRKMNHARSRLHKQDIDALPLILSAR